jgi:hypothetical protein
MHVRADGNGDRDTMTAMLMFAWDTVDRHRPLTLLAVAGVVLGALMATFGLPPVDIHGPLHFDGVMDPLCRATRAVRYAFRVEWALSWRYNPLGVVLAIGGILLLIRAAAGLTTGRWLTVRIRWSRWLLIALGILVVALEIRQLARADLLMATR